MYKKSKKILFTKIDLKENNKTVIWENFKKEIQIANEMELPYIGVYLSEHFLSTKPIKINNIFINIISQANLLNTSILYCNASENINSIIPLNNNLLWIDHIEYTDAIIIYKRFYSMILSCQSINEASFLQTLSQMTSNKLLMFPMKRINLSVDVQLKKRITKLLRIKNELYLLYTSKYRNQK